MARLDIMTPSYSRDLELFADLHRSVLANTPPSVVHHVVVPDCDVPAFSRFAGPRVRIWRLGELVPRRFVAVPKVNGWVNVRRPWPPVRGWIMQQIVKLALTAQLDADVVALIDSDVVLVRPVSAETFMDDGRASVYRDVGAVDAHLPDHLLWHDVARDLLGLPRAAAPLNDYVGSLTAWAPSVVRQLLDHVEAVTHRQWFDAIGGCLRFSEDILYGVYVDEVLGIGSPIADRRGPCHTYWDAEPLALPEALEFVRGVRPDDVAVMISAKSRTPLSVRQAAIASAAHSVGDAAVSPAARRSPPAQHRRVTSR